MNHDVHSPAHRPLVSVGMPVRNCAHTVELAIRSILHQTCPDWELLIIDDGSCDSTRERILRFGDSRIRLLADGIHRGIAGRLNQAVGLSRGKYFARMDGDDVCYPQRFARQAAYLEQHPEVDLVAASVIVFRGQGQVIGQRRIREAHDWICRRTWGSIPMPHPTWMGKRQWFLANPYDGSIMRAEDQELLLRTCRRSRFAGIEDALLGYREDRLCLSKICRGRMDHLQALVRQFAGERRCGAVLAGIVGHWLRMMADVAAIGSGLDYFILRQRAGAIDAAAASEWRSVWELNQHGGREQFCGEIPDAREVPWSETAERC